MQLCEFLCDLRVFAFFILRSALPSFTASRALIAPEDCLTAAPASRLRRFGLAANALAEHFMGDSVQSSESSKLLKKTPAVPHCWVLGKTHVLPHGSHLRWHANFQCTRPKIHPQIKYKYWSCNSPLQLPLIVKRTRNGQPKGEGYWHDLHASGLPTRLCFYPSCILIDEICMHKYCTL